MRKDVTICFRTIQEIRTALETVSRKTKRSMSLVIEDIISSYLQDNKALQSPEKEQRRFLRKRVNIPVVVRDPDTETSQLLAGTILDISLGGMRVSLSNGYAEEISISGQGDEFEALFTLPNEKRPISIKCRPHRVITNTDDKQLGASFVDSDFSSYRTLQSYLI
jgi:c-di-GMP-binding flagellar brake protein YcgR